jgi:hypothetical protein
MKHFLFPLVVCICCAAGAAGQMRGASISAEPQALNVPDHPAFASQASMGMERDIMGHSGATSGHGEVPLWEAMPETRVTPLGDLARAIRKEHTNARKAVIVWKN